jgi:hypothetical protein
MEGEQAIGHVADGTPHGIGPYPPLSAFGDPHHGEGAVVRALRLAERPVEAAEPSEHLRGFRAIRDQSNPVHIEQPGLAVGKHKLVLLLPLPGHTGFTVLRHLGLDPFVGEPVGPCRGSVLVSDGNLQRGMMIAELHEQVVPAERRTDGVDLTVRRKGWQQSLVEPPVEPLDPDPVHDQLIVDDVVQDDEVGPSTVALDTAQRSPGTLAYDEIPLAHVLQLQLALYGPCDTVGNPAVVHHIGDVGDDAFGLGSGIGDDKRVVGLGVLDPVQGHVGRVGGLARTPESLDRLYIGRRSEVVVEYAVVEDGSGVVFGEVALTPYDMPKGLIPWKIAQS